MSQQGSSNEGRRMYRAFFTSIEKDSNSDEMKARHNTTVVSTISSAQDAGSTTAESDVVGSRWWVVADRHSGPTDEYNRLGSEVTPNADPPSVT